MEPYHLSISKRITAAEICAVARRNQAVHLGEDSLRAIRHCREYLENKIRNSGSAHYGINTGFGSLCNTVIPHDKLSQLQANLLMSHACGMGDTVPEEIIRIMLLLKARSLSYGNSGVREETVQRLLDLYNLGILPVVYEQGSLGASGDLAPLAHLCLPLIGKGEVWQYGAKTPAEHAIKNAGLVPLHLVEKEGLALINGTQFISSYASLLVTRAASLLRMADVTAALSCEAWDARPDAFDIRIGQVRPHAGHLETALVMQKYLKGSEISSGNKSQVQDPYSFRCIPQVHGASKDALQHVTGIVETEINSVTDNPNIFPDEDAIISGGNFHGQPLALPLDYLAMALSEIGSIAERRLYLLISGQRGLPAFLTPDPGLHSGFMIVQYTAAAIASQNKQLCSPASVDSIVSSNGQEDHVSMGANAATKCYRVLKNVERIIGLELMTAAQAFDMREGRSSELLTALHNDFRTKVPFVERDTELYPLMHAAEQYITDASRQV